MSTQRCAAPLTGLDPHEYGHPFDEQALESLKKIPGFEALSEAIIKHGVERLEIISCTGSHLQVTPDNCAELHDLLLQVCETLSLATIPRFYLSAEDGINAKTTGSLNPIIILNSEAVDRLTDEELLFLIGHECGHVKSRHVQYHGLASSSTVLGEMIGDYTFGLGNLASGALNLGLLRWSRFSELSSDRAGLLSCQNLDTALSVLIKMAGLPEKYSVNTFRDSFLRQAAEFESIDFDKASKIFKFALGLEKSHPWTVMRAAELMRWVKSGEYEMVLKRQTTRRKHVCTVDGTELCRTCGYRLKGMESFCPTCGSNLCQ